MKSIQMLLTVFVIAALCGIVKSYNKYDYKVRGYCTNGDCRSGYFYYGNTGYCQYGSRSYRYNCASYAGCCLPRNPSGKFRYYCTKRKNRCRGDYYFYNNKGYYYYGNNAYYNCRSYRGCCFRKSK
ncbi:uncharacterized protein LOC143061977 [Mytilus galloprovincialis]|uniref:uncharacterized protein LOC143061977 n=1 Tax=Mytilus galloprovincialis TaxID=29158 RepID=UPI003F7BE245